MISAVFFISAFGFLGACHSQKNFCEARSWGGFFGAHLIRTLEVLLYVSVLFVLYDSVLLRYVPEAGSLYPLLFLLAAYVLQRLRNKDEFFIWFIYALCLFSVSQPAERSLVVVLLYLFKTIFMVFLFTVTLLGLQRRLEYSNLPVSSRGLPVYFLSAAVLALLLWAMRIILS